jgi:hypothetical protein
VIETLSNEHQVISDGHRVWVNGPGGDAVGRLGYFAGKAMVDIHLPLSQQRETGGECLDCRHDLPPGEAWEHFVRGIRGHFGVEIVERHRPRWAR